jgi:hypothetical protein
VAKYFTPPVVYDNPPILPDDRSTGYRLFRYYPNRPRFVTVFALSDGSFVQETATKENSNTNIPYPYDPYNPSAPYSTSYFINFEVKPPVQDKITVTHDVWITKVYQQKQYITDAEATALTSAGYGALITTS